MAACLNLERVRKRVLRITHRENRDGKKPMVITKSVLNTENITTATYPSITATAFLDKA